MPEINACTNLCYKKLKSKPLANLSIKIKRNCHPRYLLRTCGVHGVRDPRHLLTICCTKPKRFFVNACAICQQPSVLNPTKSEWPSHLVIIFGSKTFDYNLYSHLRGIFQISFETFWWKQILIETPEKIPEDGRNKLSRKP